MFPDTYMKLLRKYTNLEEYEIIAASLDYKTKYNSNIFQLINSVSRSNKQGLEILNVVLAGYMKELNEHSRP